MSGVGQNQFRRVRRLEARGAGQGNESATDLGGLRGGRTFVEEARTVKRSPEVKSFL